MNQTIESDQELVIGNTTIKLANIVRNSSPTYHISDVSCLLDVNSIRHNSPRKTDPKNEMIIAITAGVLTPNNVINEIISKLLYLRGESI